MESLFSRAHANSIKLIFFIHFSFLLLFAGIDETVEQVRAAGGSCVGYKVDISKKEEVYKAADAIRRDAGDVSIFFSFAEKKKRSK